MAAHAGTNKGRHAVGNRPRKGSRSNPQLSGQTEISGYTVRMRLIRSSSHAKTLFTLLLGLLAAGSISMKAEENKPTDSAKKTELATFGGGCFWCTEAIFERFKGVKA